MDARLPGGLSTTTSATASIPIKLLAGGLGLLLAVGVVAGVGYVSSYGSRVYPGVRAAGVQLDGLAPEAIPSVLQSRARALAETRVQVRAGDQVWQPTFAELGVDTDVDSLARQAYSVGRTGSPIERAMAIGGALSGPYDVGGSRIRRDRIDEWVANAARQVDRPAVDAAIAIQGSQVVVTPSQVGRRVDRAQASEAIGRNLESWLTNQESEGFRSVLVPVAELPPKVTERDLAPLQAEASRILSRPVTLRVDGDSWQIQPAEMAAALTFERRGDSSAVALKPDALTALVDRVAPLAERAPTPASLSVSPQGQVRFTPDVVGRIVDRTAAVEALRAAILSPDAGGNVVLPVTRPAANVTAAHLERARQDAEHALSSPIELKAGDQTLVLNKADIAGILRFAVGPDGKTAQVIADPSGLRDRLADLSKKVDRPARHARLTIEGGAPAPRGAAASLPGGGAGSKVRAIEEGQQGQKLDVEAALAAIATGLTAPQRTIALPVAITPAFTSSNIAAFGQLDLIEWGTTSYGGGVAERSHNVELAAERINGVVVPPGEKFSFNQATGPQTTANGFKQSWGIMGGATPGAPPRTVPSIGGGICQVATTLFHAVFWSGYQIDERNWHLYWIPKYGTQPKGIQGLDATVDDATGTDFVWTNTGDSPIVVQARTDGDLVSFGLYGKKPSWTVEVGKPVIDQYVRTTGESVRQREPSIPPGASLQVETARDGFRATIVRTVIEPGKDPRVLRLVSQYAPSRNVFVFN